MNFSFITKSYIHIPKYIIQFYHTCNAFCSLKSSVFKIGFHLYHAKARGNLLFTKE